MIESWLFARLAGLVDQRVYGGQAPPNTPTPYILFKQVSGTRKAIDACDDCRSERWQIDSYAGSDYSAGRELARQIESAVSLLGINNELCVISSEIEGPDDLYDQRVEQHYQSTDLIIDYTE